MFETDKILRFVSILVGIGFLVSSVSGFVEVSKDMVISNVFLSLHSIVLFSGTIYFEFVNTMSKNTYFFRGLAHLYSNFLILGLSNLSLGFGIFGIFMGIINLMTYYIKKDISPNIDQS